MTPQLQKAFDDAAVPFLGGAIAPEHTRMRSWRYFLEINSVCNLHCPSCTKGNQKGYDHLTGIMDADLMERILDKIAKENPDAIVFTYGNSEPFLHPDLAGCLASIKRRGLHPELSTNLNVIRKVEDVLAAKPDMIIISLSGFTQDVYVKGHAGGNIERVKDNMRVIAEANNALPLEKQVNIQVNYHVYKDNEHEIDLMRTYAHNLGLGFFTSIARAISMENAIQYCRAYDLERMPFEVQEGRPDWNTALPPIGQTYIDVVGRMKIPPDTAREMYKGVPLHDVCPIGAGGIFTFIRHDGKTEMCACVADRRITLGDYLDTPAEELAASRVGHSICQQCIKYRLNLYFMIADREKWVP